MKKSLLGMLRKTAYWILNLVGMNAFYRRKTAECVRIFALHGVADYEDTHDWEPLREQMSVTRFRAYLSALSRHYQFVSMDEATRILAGRQQPRRNLIVLSFDDGYRNNLTEALPVLKEFDAPGIFYLATGFVENRHPFWFDRLDYVLQVASRQKVEFEIAGRLFILSSDSRHAISSLYKDVRDHCKARFRDDQEFGSALDGLAEYLEEVTGVALVDTLEHDHWAAVVNGQDIANFASDPHVTFGSHTVHHTRLGCTELAEVQHEVQNSKSQIEKWTGKECMHFAFPNGSFDDQSVHEIESSGYLSAVTSEPGLNSVGSNMYTIQRLNMQNDCTIAELLARASGLEARIAKITEFLRSLGRTRRHQGES